MKKPSTPINWINWKSPSTSRLMSNYRKWRKRHKQLVNKSHRANRK